MSKQDALNKFPPLNARAYHHLTTLEKFRVQVATHIRAALDHLMIQ